MGKRMADEERKSILIDTSIWLEYLLDQGRADEVEHMFASTPFQRMCVTEFTIGSIGIILTNNQHPDPFWQFTDDLFLEGEVSRLTLSSEQLATIPNVMNRFRLDFDDAYQYVAAAESELPIVSFDDDFDRTDLEWVAPSSLDSLISDE